MWGAGTRGRAPGVLSTAVPTVPVPVAALPEETTMQTTPRIAAMCLALTCALVSACAPRLVVQHDDPTAGEIEVTVDGTRTRTLRPGNRWKVRLDQGWHEVDVRADGGRVNPYTDDGDPWVLWHDRGTRITLSPPASRR